ncbi:MAG: type II toxin-antitoxin system YafQ family toxin, partial [Candidatus Ornithomonoglobus sp.]
WSNRYKRDVKLCVKRGCNMSLLYEIINTLRIPQPLSQTNKDHALKGDYAGHRECHITPDWLLIYRIEGDNLYLDRTGTHSDLFDM